MTRVIIYTRVSTEEQAREGHSLEAQYDICARFAEQREWTVVDHFTDEGASGSTDARPGFRRVVVAVQNGDTDVLLTHKLDRFSRSVTDILLYFRRFHELGVSYASATEQFDFTTPFGKVVLAVIAAFAEWYIDNLSQEVSKGKLKRAEKGLWNGEPPFGYRKTEDGKLEPDPQTAPAIPLVFVKYAAGTHSFPKLAELLNRKGYRTRIDRPFSSDSLRKIMSNRFYLGEVPYRGYERIGTRSVRRKKVPYYPGQHEALLPKDLFDKAQVVRRKRHAKQTDHGPRAGRFYPATNLVICEEGGTRLRGAFVRGERRYYDPGKSYYGLDCTQKRHVNAEVLEDSLGRIIGNVTLPDDWRAAITAATQGIDPRTVDRQRRGLQAQLKRAKRLFVLGDFSEREYETEKASIRSMLDTLLPVQSGETYETGELINKFKFYWENAKPKERKRLLQATLETVYVKDDDVFALQPKQGFYALLQCAVDGSGPDGI